MGTWTYDVPSTTYQVQQEDNKQQLAAVSCCTGCTRVARIHFFFFFFILRRMGKTNSPHFHVFSYASCVDLTQLPSQPNASWRILRIPLRYSDSVSCPYQRSSLQPRQRKLIMYVLLQQQHSITATCSAREPRPYSYLTGQQHHQQP